MLKKYRKEIIDTLKELGIDNTIVSFREEEDGLVLAYVNNDKLYFKVKYLEKDIHHFDLGYTRFDRVFSRKEPFWTYGIDEIITHLSGWVTTHLTEIHNDYRESDPLKNWGDDKNILVNIENIDFSSTDLFTLNEQLSIEKALIEAKGLIEKEFSPNDKQQKKIDEGIQYLVEASKRSTKTDWKNLLISTLFGYSMNLMLPPEGVKKLFGLFNKVLHDIPSLSELINYLPV